MAQPCGLAGIGRESDEDKVAAVCKRGAVVSGVCENERAPSYLGSSLPSFALSVQTLAPL